MSRSHGVTEAELAALTDHEHGTAFDGKERAVLDYAVAMTEAPVDVADELFARLRQHLTDPQIVELSAAIAWENFRARFNHALAIPSEGFSEGAFCPLPDRRALDVPAS